MNTKLTLTVELTDRLQSLLLSDVLATLGVSDPAANAQVLLDSAITQPLATGVIKRTLTDLVRRDVDRVVTEELIRQRPRRPLSIVPGPETEFDTAFDAALAAGIADGSVIEVTPLRRPSVPGPAFEEAA